MKNCPDGGHCNNEDMIEELTQALAALLWQHDHNDGKLCGMALQDARAALAKARPEQTGPHDHPAAICPVCGREMEWTRFDDGHDWYTCEVEDCQNYGQVPIARERWTWYVNVYEVGQSYGGPEEGGWYYNTGNPITSVRCDTRSEAEELREAFEIDYPNTGKRTSVLGGDDYRVCIEDHYGAPFPTERPHYE